MPGIVIVIVQLPIAKRTAEKAIESARRTASTYTALADKGLIKKYDLNGEAGAGGVYLWQSEQAARAWYTPEWADRMQATHGVRPVVAYYDCHVTVDNETSEVRATPAG